MSNTPHQSRHILCEIYFSFSCCPANVYLYFPRFQLYLHKVRIHASSRDSSPILTTCCWPIIAHLVTVIWFMFCSLHCQEFFFGEELGMGAGWEAVSLSAVSFYYLQNFIFLLQAGNMDKYGTCFCIYFNACKYVLSMTSYVLDFIFIKSSTWGAALQGCTSYYTF